MRMCIVVQFVVGSCVVPDASALLALSDRKEWINFEVPFFSLGNEACLLDCEMQGICNRFGLSYQLLYIFDIVVPLECTVLVLNRIWLKALGSLSHSENYYKDLAD